VGALLPEAVGQSIGHVEGRGGNLRSRARFVTLSLLVVVLVGVDQGVPAWEPVSQATGRGADAVQLLPNLQPFPAFNLLIQRVGRRRALRLSAKIADAGAGPLEVYPIANDCDGNGDPTDDRSGYQRTFADMDGDGAFTRGVDTKQTSRFAGCFFFHPQHGHWHFEDWAHYDLVRLSDGVLVSSGGKTSFCIADTDHAFPALPGSPAFAYYGLSCDPDDTEGLSVGWGDTYTADLQGQVIPITWVVPGDYCVIVRADPDDRLLESNESDNLSYVPVHIQGTSVTTIGSSCWPGR
jgi:hypothetical protein